MKKVLLATTILGMTAGFAAAEITWTGEATAGFAQNGVKNGGKSSASAGTFLNYGAGVFSGTVATQTAATTAATATNTAINAKTADSVINPYASFKLAATATAESDSGLTFGASVDVTAGTTYAMANDDGFSVKSGALGTPTVFVSGDFGKVAVKADGYKEYQDDSNEKYDIEYTHTIAGVSIGVRTDLQSDNATTKGKSSVKLGYTAGPIALEAKADEVGSKWGVTAGYTMGAITATVGTDNASVSSLKLAYKGENGITADIKGKSNNEVEANVGYTANGMTLGATVTGGTKVSGVDTNKWKVTASYDLGGGLSVEAGANYTDDAFLGAKMKF